MGWKANQKGWPLKIKVKFVQHRGGATKFPFHLFRSQGENHRITIPVLETWKDQPPTPSRGVFRGSLRLSDQQALTLRDAEVVFEEGGIKARQEMAEITQQLLESIWKTTGVRMGNTGGCLEEILCRRHSQNMPRYTNYITIWEQAPSLSLSLSLCSRFVFVPILNMSKKT